MAALTPQQLVEIRKRVAQGETEVAWDKSQINAIIQVLEDWYEAERPTVSALMDTATAPFVFSNAVKKKVGAWFLKQKSDRERV